ncbi:MAG: o-succinylbenzoate synthase [Candidatus Desulfatibia sp.]|uniref:o-succinylbenzoate synthase n=1 Tax=Candidatus Desulfatibia sp. TaxID=3101189 RepID=UPI002F2CA589
MKIAEIIIYRFRLKLKQPLTLKNKILRFREGFVVRLADESGNHGWGEISPLIGFSRETIEQAGRELALLPSTITGCAIPPNVELLNGGFEDWLGGFNLSASVRFGLESAVLNMQAMSKQLGLHRLLDAKAAARVAVNALLSGTREQIEVKANALLGKGYRAFKLKVGRLSLDEDIEMVAGVRNIIGQDTLLRLDANRTWNLDDALKFMQRAVQFNINYIEEPLQSFYQLKKLMQDCSPPLPVALDESLLEISPPELPLLPALKAIVIKPTLLGFERAMRFARAAQDNGITPVISAAFESSLGLLALASMAAVINHGQTPAGLDTLAWLEEDLPETPMRIQTGKIVLDDDSNLMKNIKMELLEEFT